LTIFKERTRPDFQNTPSNTNLKEEEIMDVPGNNDNASMSGQVERSEAWM
jgi:hypothetical protein